MAEKALTLNATTIISTVNKWYADLYPIWVRERMMIDFYNGGRIPTDREDEFDEDAPVSLGLGNRYIKKPFDALMDTVIMKPGFIKTDIEFPVNPQRKGRVQSAVDSQVNEIVMPRMESAIRRVAGRAIITGRAFFYRLSRWDWLFKTGRMLHPLEVTDDWLSESFRDWAFSGEISLRQLDQYIDNTRDYDGAGWNRKGMLALKQYILKKNPVDDNDARERIVDRLLVTPFSDELCRMSPLRVYWYFRKNGTKNDQGQERVDLYCVSRWGQEQAIEELKDGNYVYKTVKVDQGKGVEDQILYHLPDAFENVEECLVPVILDSRVDGYQEMAQIDGQGKIMIPRLLMMEQIALSTAEGIAFGCQPNWTSATGAAIDKDELRRLQREGISVNDYIPPTLVPMKKESALTGVNAGMALLQMLGMSAEQDAGTGEMPVFGQGEHGAKFKVQAMQLMQAANSAVTRRSARFWSTMDMLADNQLRTFCRPFVEWNEADAGYHDVRRFQMALWRKWGIMPQEYDPRRLKGVCRRLSGDQDRQTTFQQGAVTLQVLGGSMSPQSVRFIQKEMYRAQWGDAEADLAYPDQPEQNPDQLARAQEQTAFALAAGMPPPRQGEDNVMVHVPIHAQVLQTRLQASMQAGSATPSEKAGLAALLQHLAGDAAGLPPQMQQQLQQPLKQAAMMIQKLPVSGASTEIGLKERQVDLKEKALQFSMQREGNLQNDRQKKLQQKDRALTFNEQAQLRRLLMEGDNAKVSRAKQIFGMILDSHEANQPDQAPADTANA